MKKSKIDSGDKRPLITAKTGLAIATVIVFMIAISSCKKKTETPEQTAEPDTEQATITDNNFAENISGDIESMGSQVSENASLSTYKVSGPMVSTDLLTVTPCATVTSVPASKIFTVDFGTTGCVGLDGHTRTGKLIYNYSASTGTAMYYRNPGFNLSVSSQNYVVDGNTVTINSKNISNTTPTTIPTSVNPGINLTWQITANIAIAKQGGGSVTWTCTRTKELVNTSDTLCYRGQFRPIRWDRSIVKLNGTAAGTNARGETYTAVATNLVRDFNCVFSGLRKHPFVSGTLAYTPGTRPTRLIDYGTGACDLDATVTISGNTYTITLP